MKARHQLSAKLVCIQFYSYFNSLILKEGVKSSEIKSCVIEEINDNKILSLLEEVKDLNKLNILTDPDFGDFLVIKFKPQNQIDIYYFVAEIKNLKEDSLKEKQSILDHLEMIKSLLEILNIST